MDLLYINEKENKYENYFKPYKGGIYKIKLLIFINMTDYSYIFYNCKKIKEIIFTNFNINNVTDMSYMFPGCYELSTLPDILKWNTNNVTNISHKFSHFHELSSLSDISNWNTNNVTDMSYKFNYCSNLIA